jgi:hypothetical protein
VSEVSFTFHEAGTQPDSGYRVAGHVANDAAIFGPPDRIRRRRQLVRFFGSLVLKSE